MPLLLRYLTLKGVPVLLLWGVQGKGSLRGAHFDATARALSESPQCSPLLKMSYLAKRVWVVPPVLLPAHAWQ